MTPPQTEQLCGSETCMEEVASCILRKLACPCQHLPPGPLTLCPQRGVGQPGEDAALVL